MIATSLRAIVETAVDGVILMDDRGKVTLFNRACERIFGYDAAEIVGENVKRLMPEPYRDEHDQYLVNYQQSGQRKIIGIGRRVARSAQVRRGLSAWIFPWARRPPRMRSFTSAFCAT